MSNHADAQQDTNMKIGSSLPEQIKSNLKADTRGLGRAEWWIICRQRACRREAAP